MRSIITVIFFTLLFSDLYSQTEQPKLIITHLTGDFYIYTTFNIYKEHTVPANGMYVVTDSGVILFDSPWDTTQFQPLLDSIKWRHNKDIKICIATHSHEDRTGGLAFFKQLGVKTYTTEMTDRISTEKGRKRAQYLIQNDTIFKIGKYCFQTYYGGKGHAPDNIVVWFDKEKILYGGCLIKSVEAEDLGNLSDATVKDWKWTLINIQKKFKKPKFIITGHNDWNSNKSITHTLNLIKKYEHKN